MDSSLQKSASMSVLTMEGLATDGGGAAILWGFYSGDVCGVWGFGLTTGLHDKMLKENGDDYSILGYMGNIGVM